MNNILTLNKISKNGLDRFGERYVCSNDVKEVLLRLHEKGFIYKGSRIINWCPVCKTSLSDAEVEHEEQDGFFWHIKYPIVGTDRFLEIATTRPETLLGDTAIAVHPDDERYKDIVGKNVILPLVGREIPIVADAYVDKEFGTGAVKITPAHDPNDFEVGKRHNLPEINIMNDDATINEKGGKYAGMDRYEARKAIVADLDEQGYLVKVVPHMHAVGTHDRCGTTVEPLIKQQWFVKMDEMAKAAIKALDDGDLKFVPSRFDKTYLHWLENIRDWCISRQIWWGHRIPAYYCDECGEFVVAKEAPEKCPHCGCTHFTQDEDTLDTWFSSALWPFSTLGWPEKTEDLDYFYPTDVLVTGYDIIFFWVIRMVFSGYEHTGKAPFNTVLIHGLVRDSQGRKMSKSLGNGIDPLEIIDKYGADALRLTLITGNAPGNDMRFYNERVEASRNFANKVWNGTMPVLDGHFTVDFVPGSTSVQVRFSESFSVRFEPERAKDRSICLSFDGDDFRAVEGPGLQNVEYTRSTVEATGENMQYEVGISTGTRTYLEVTGSGESRVRYERDGKKGYFTAQDAPFTVVLRDRDQQEPLDTMDFPAGETCTIRIRDGVPSFAR